MVRKPSLVSGWEGTGIAILSFVHAAFCPTWTGHRSREQPVTCRRRHDHLPDQEASRPMVASTAPSTARTPARASANQAHPDSSTAKVTPAIAARTTAATSRSGPILDDRRGRRDGPEPCSFLGIERQ